MCFDFLKKLFEKKAESVFVVYNFNYLRIPKKIILYTNNFYYLCQ